MITLPLSMVVKFLFWINKFVYMRPGHMWNNNNLSIFSGTDKKFLWSVVRRLKAVSTGANIVKFRSIRFSLWSRPVICNNRVKVDKPNFWTVMNGPSSKESSNSYWNQEIEVYIYVCLYLYYLHWRQGVLWRSVFVTAPCAFIKLATKCPAHGAYQYKRQWRGVLVVSWSRIT